jgi:hypothetical protein
MNENPEISSPLSCAGFIVTTLLAMSSMASAQTTVFQDNMEGGSGGLNGRTVSPTAQVGASNQWWGSQSGQTSITSLSFKNTGNGETAFTQLAAVSYTGDIGGLWFKADSLSTSAHPGFFV